MDYSIDQKEGFLLIIGDPGTGKTTLLKVFMEKWKSKAEIAIVLTPRLSPEEFLVSVAEDLKIDYGNRNKNETIRALRDFMTQKTSEGKRVIIIVDEAQNLPVETLEELRLLSNLETDKDKLLQIILLGQPELESKLKAENLRQLNQRIVTRVHLQRFNRDETQDYINFRVIKGGKENLRIHKKAGKIVHLLTNGVPRLINMLMSRALMAAYLEESSIVLPKHIHYAVKSLNHSEMKWRGDIRTAFVAAAAVPVLLIAGFSYFSLSGVKTVAGTGPLHSYEQIQALSAAEVMSNDTIEEFPFKLITVNVDVAVIRNSPSVDAGKIGWLLKGDQLVVLRESMDDWNMKWYQIPFQGGKQWIAEEVTEEVNIR